MVTLSADMERLLTEFSRAPGVSQDQVENLRSAVVNSPALSTQVDAAIGAGHLQHFALLPAGTNAGGTYDGDAKTINLPASILSTPATPSDRQAAELTFVLGHEIQHGFNHAQTRQAYTQFESAVEASTRGDRDYTRAIGDLLSTNRNDEATANLAGWNALVGMVKTTNPEATLGDIYAANLRAEDFVTRTPGPPTTYLAHPDLTINDDLSITPTADNVEGMAKHYFDKAPHLAQLGHNGNSDYQNYYGAYAIGRASQYAALNVGPDATTGMTINMQQLRLQESLVEQNGISLGEGNPPPQPYHDSSSSPPTLHHFEHTATTHTHVPIVAQGFAGQPLHAAGIETSLSHCMDRGNPTPQLSGTDRILHEQIRSKVAELDAAHGRSFDATSERLSASLLVVAREQGLDRVDHVVLSQKTSHAAAAQNIFLVKGALDDPAAVRAATSTAEAAQRPVEDSFDNLLLVNQRNADQASQEHARQQGQEQQRSAPSQ